MINGAVNWLKKLKNWEIISSYKILSKTFTVLLVLEGGSHFTLPLSIPKNVLTKLTCCKTRNEHDRHQTAILRLTRKKEKWTSSKCSVPLHGHISNSCKESQVICHFVRRQCTPVSWIGRSRDVRCAFVTGYQCTADNQFFFPKLVLLFTDVFSFWWKVLSFKFNSLNLWIHSQMVF